MFLILNFFPTFIAVTQATYCAHLRSRVRNYITPFRLMTDAICDGLGLIVADKTAAVALCDKITGITWNNLTFSVHQLCKTREFCKSTLSN